ncbi:MAG: hypothetical protein GKR89_00960 [Candidatus Latescibacteria bacterium]|nr:hypothetical protein [Candidatus Latescibacterota bacterium]
MTADDITSRYNYDEFVPAKFHPWMRFGESPPLGEAAPDFPLQQLDGTATSLKEVVKAHLYTIAEFGSFT